MENELEIISNKNNLYENRNSGRMIFFVGNFCRFHDDIIKDDMSFNELIPRRRFKNPLEMKKYTLTRQPLFCSKRPIIRSNRMKMRTISINNILNIHLQVCT